MLPICLSTSKWLTYFDLLNHPKAIRCFFVISIPQRKHPAWIAPKLFQHNFGCHQVALAKATHLEQFPLQGIHCFRCHGNLWSKLNPGFLGIPKIPVQTSPNRKYHPGQPEDTPTFLAKSSGDFGFKLPLPASRSTQSATLVTSWLLKQNCGWPDGLLLKTPNFICIFHIDSYRAAAPRSSLHLPLPIERPGCGESWNRQLWKLENLRNSAVNWYLLG